MARGFKQPGNRNRKRRFPSDVGRYPTGGETWSRSWSCERFVYEALLEGVLLFLILNFTFKKKSYKKGKCAALFLIFYSLLRIFSEFFREPDLQIGYIFNLISMGSLLSLFMFSVGIIMYFKVR